MAAELTTNRFGVASWISRETEFHSIVSRLIDTPSSGIAAWARTTSGVVALLLFVQIATGILLAFHYVPIVTSAYTTVSYIELAVGSGSWLRSMHYHSSVLLPVVLALHLLQMIVRQAYRSHWAAWVFALIALGLVLAAGATGYALPWDARSINGVNIAASLAGNAPLIGSWAKAWLLGGTTISTLTLSRFYALHVWIVPLSILILSAARIFIFGRQNGEIADHDRANWFRTQLMRNAVAVALIFVGLAVFSNAFPAPFGPQVTDAATYLPRPGPQFLWLFEMQKYTDGPLAAMLAMGVPAFVIGGLIVLPLFIRGKVGLLQTAVSTVFVIGFGLVLTLTAAAIYQDSSDERISQQLAKQEADEDLFRTSKFEPVLQRIERPQKTSEPASETQLAAEVPAEPETGLAVPVVYTANCAKCHGASGEGTKKFPEVAGVTSREEDQLTPEMVLAIINDPKSEGRGSKMPAYKNKLSETEKQEIVTWIRSLHPISDNTQQ